MSIQKGLGHAISTHVPKLSLVLLVGQLFFAPHVFAKTLLLDQAVNNTLKNNPSLRVFPLRQQGLVGEKKTASLNPAMNIGAEIENFSGTGELSGIKGLETTVSLSSVLELGDKRAARMSLVDEKANNVDIESEIESLDLIGEVTRRFTEVLNVQARLDLAIESLNLANEALEEVTKRVNAAIAPAADMGRAKAAVQQAELNISLIKQQLSASRMALANLWGSLQPEFSDVAGSLYTFKQAKPFEQLFELVKQNPSIRFYAAESRIRDAEIRLAKTQSVADLSWSVGIRRNEEINQSALVAGFSMPLFSGKRAQGRIESALAAKNEVIFREESTLLSLHTQLYKAYTGREQSIAAVNQLKSEIIPNLRLSLEQTQTAYRRGLYSYLDLLSARRELLQAKQALIDSATAAVRYGIEVEQLTAVPLTAEASL
ncbi:MULTISPECIES: TolC family protein [Methylophaga]|jgi:cobalt-zinc-cadmium efflux system outer membrane protein|uniref:TolC family protein n=1 Tax=Methylophaga TaxID=40222 RepID=UPI001763A8E3|nr:MULTISPECIES: TolC family protein [Methylophaga]HIC46870.1 TolC family protein [Methylophaga sp.]